MGPLFSVLFPVCSRFKRGKQSTFPVFYDLRWSEEMKMKKTPRNVWTVQEQEEQ
jgi:hypothetical protein